MVRELIEDARVKLGTAIACFVAMIAYVRHDTAWGTNVDGRFERLEETTERIDRKIDGRTEDRWHRRDMLKYSVDAERLNKDWKAPDVQWESR